MLESEFPVAKRSLPELRSEPSLVKSVILEGLWPGESGEAGEKVFRSSLIRGKLYFYREAGSVRGFALGNLNGRLLCSSGT